MVKPKAIACYVCGRKFKTTQALRQHKVENHPRPQPGVAGRKKKLGKANSVTERVVLSGSDIYKVIRVGKNTSAGKSLANLRISPLSLVGSRFKQVSSNWARWRPLKLQVKVMGGGSALTFGSVAFGWSPDSAVNPLESSSSQENVHKVMALKPGINIRLNGSAVISVPCETTRKWYLRHGSVEDTTHGTVLGVVSSTTGGYDGEVDIMISLNWTVEFEGVELEDTGSGEQVINPDSGYDHLFLTSDGSWDSSRLTFKNVEGGSMVPWSSARPGMIYGYLNEATKIMYVAEDGSYKFARYFTLVQDYTVPGLVAHASWLDAIRYIADGDPQLCLKYVKAGPYCKPARPSLQRMQEDYPSRALMEENDRLRARLAVYEGPQNAVRDFALRDQLELILRNLRFRPLGTSGDPVYVADESKDDENGLSSSVVCLSLDDGASGLSETLDANPI